jgi:GntR family transcriptional regulator / MocR family aminotransferase
MAARRGRPRRAGGDPAVRRAAPGHDEADVVEAAAERGVAVEGVAPLRIAAGGPPALVLGSARLPEHRIAEAIRLLAEATTMTGPGRRRPGPHA